jgi:spore coat polysaccharide biosynthesis protein SpsF
MLCIVQARCGSKRLKRKIFKKIHNISIIQRVINNLKKSKQISKIIIATSKYKEDDDIEVFCKKNKIQFYRGSLNNVASRFVEIAKIYKVKEIIRISCDSPFIDSKLIDIGIKKFNKSKFHLLTNVFPRTFPKGLSFEIFKTSILENNINNYSKNDKEHVTKFFYKNFNKFKIFNLKAKKKYENINLCVDTLVDLNFLRKNFKIISMRSFL